MQRIEVGVLGATGMVGQHFIRFLEGHPWFDLTWLGASDRSAGKKYTDATTWRLDGTLPPHAAGLRVEANLSSDKIGAKIRQATLDKVPYMLVVGEKEMGENKVAVRHRTEGDKGVISVEQFVIDVSAKIQDRQ